MARRTGLRDDRSSEPRAPDDSDAPGASGAHRHPIGPRGVAARHPPPLRHPIAAARHPDSAGLFGRKRRKTKPIWTWSTSCFTTAARAPVRDSRN